MMDGENDKTYRCEGHDYAAPCIYGITVNLLDWRSAALGRIVVDAHDAAGIPSAAHCETTELGKVVADCWESIAKYYPQIRVIGKQVMPEHFHGLLWVQERLPCSLGQVVKGFKTGCNKTARAMGVTFAATLSQPQDATRGGVGLWARGFQDTILWRKGQLANMIDYLRTNPLRRAIKTAMPELFHRVALLEREGLSFQALGNRYLLDRPMRQVQCSRSFFGYRRTRDAGGNLKVVHDANGEPVIAFERPEYRERLASCLNAAQHGVVLISPCVSDGERQIAREAFKCECPLIVLCNKGFGKLEKPSGIYFKACAAGRFLQLAPAAWPYVPAKKVMTREDATAMNRLAQWLAGDGAAEINYHGQQPADIDALARAAAQCHRLCCHYPSA